MSCHVMSKLNWGCWASKEKEKLSEFKRKPKSKFIYVYFLIPSVFFLVQFKEPLSPFFFFFASVSFYTFSGPVPIIIFVKNKKARPGAAVEAHIYVYKMEKSQRFPLWSVFTEPQRDCGTLARIFDRWLGAFACAFGDTIHAQSRSKEKRAKILIGKTWRRRYSVGLWLEVKTILPATSFALRCQ